MMRFQILMILMALAAPGVSYAQNTPFQSPALDSNCYFPQIGDPSEMDTIVGSVPNQYLGSPVIKNMGPKPDGSYGNMLIGNISTTVALAQVATGPGFNLHQMKQFPQRAGGIYLSSGFTLGHFRDRQHLDLFNGRIYWADDNGNYDSSRYTVLKANLPVNIRPGTDRRIEGGPFPWYVAHLTSDSVDDIIISNYTDNTDTTFPYHNYDTAYVLLYRGGQQLYGKDTAYEDTSAYLFPLVPYVNDILNCTQADFRGVRRDDLMVSHYGLVWYYKNDPPFSLEKFAHEVAKDTFIAEGLGSATNAGPPQYFPMSALPKKTDDHSSDLLLIATVDTGSAPPSIYIFRGGPDFGSHRITLDSAAFVITEPFQYTYGWPYSVADAGDMTGTGNHVLYTAGAWSNDNQTDNFFVTGMALDNKIDIYNVANSGSQGDTLTANNDSLEDFMLTRAGGIGSGNYGTLWLYYGSMQIPVHLDSQWAEVKTEIENIPQRDGAGISFAPNPVTQGWSVATIIWPEAENAEYSVYDMLGRLCDHGPIRLLGGAEEQRIYFSGLPSGTYLYNITGARHTANARIVKLGGNESSGTPAPSFMQSLRDARYGKRTSEQLSPTITR